MIWFGKRLLFAGVYGPIAFAGLLVPHLFGQYNEQKRAVRPLEAMLGFGLSQALIAAGLTGLGAKSGYMPALWATVSVLGSLIFSIKVILG